MTAAEFVCHPDRKLYELEDGRLVDRPSGVAASYTAGQLMCQLGNYADQHAPDFSLCMGLSCGCFPGRPDTVRWASAAGFWVKRLSPADWDEEPTTLPPDLVVRPVYPNEPASAVAGRVAEWHAAGVPLVLVIDPAEECVTAYEPNRRVRVYGAGDTLTGEPVLPGFAVPVADLFELPTDA